MIWAVIGVVLLLAMAGVALAASWAVVCIDRMERIEQERNS